MINRVNFTSPAFQATRYIDVRNQTLAKQGITQPDRINDARAAAVDVAEFNTELCGGKAWYNGAIHDGTNFPKRQERDGLPKYVWELYIPDEPPDAITEVVSIAEQLGVVLKADKPE